MFDQIIARAVERELDRRASLYGRGGEGLPQGYNPAEVIRAAMFPWVQVPFAGRKVWCQLRTLNRTQLDACGAVTLIDVDGEKEGGRPPSFGAIIDMRNKQEALAKEVLVRPTFDEIVLMITGIDFIAEVKRKRLEDIKAIDISSCTAAEKADIQERIDNLELALAYVLPEDSLEFLTSWALCVDVTDIKKLSRDQLLDAAVLAVNGHDSPHNHIEGVFTDRDKGDINKTAWLVYNEHMREKETEKGRGGMRWIGRRKRK